MIRDQHDLGSGLLFLGVGGAALWLAHDLPLGSAAAMDSGYVPRLLAFLLLGIGSLLTIRAFRRDGAVVTGWAWRPLAAVLAAVAAFALLLETAGLVATTVALVGLASFAAHTRTIRRTMALAAVLAVLVTGIFVGALGLNLPVWPR